MTKPTNGNYIFKSLLGLAALIPATTLAGTSSRWSQSGFSVPAQMALRYAHIAAISVWAAVVVLGLAKLAGAIIALWRSR